MGKINKEWHLANKMSKKASFEQRVEWHKGHLKNCSCRTDLPPEIEKAIAIEGDNTDYWMLLARVRAREEGDARALDYYARAAALGEGIPSYHFSYAICLWRLCGAGRDPLGAAAALSQLRRAIRCNPHDPDYRLLMGDWFEKTGQGGASLIEYQRALALIETAQLTPHKIRRLSPESLERLRAMTGEKIRDLERDVRGKKDRQ